MGRAVEKQVRWFWRFIMMPVLFGLVGASINFSTIENGMIPKACAIVIAGSTPSNAQNFFFLLCQGTSRRSQTSFWHWRHSHHDALPCASQWWALSDTPVCAQYDPARYLFHWKLRIRCGNMDA